MRIKVGEYEILDSGIIMSVRDRDILFEIEENIKVKLVLTTVEDNVQLMNAEVDSSGILVFTLQNFNNPLGTEFTEAIEVGTYQGRRLLFHVRVLGMDSTTNRAVIYTWYLGNNINNG